MDASAASSYTELTPILEAAVLSETAHYHKSAKGIEAIASRQHGLSPKLRSLLILIDGKRGFAELAKLSRMLGDPRELLTQLLDAGFIEPVELAQTPATPAATPSPIAVRNAVTLPQAQRFAVRRLTDILGPTAQSLCLRIESARNVPDFTAALARAQSIVREFNGAQAAATFEADMQAYRPRA